MITVYQKGELHFQKKIYKCAIGRNGIKKKKLEGDGCTPEGTYSLGPLYYRSDRIKKLKTYFKSIPIEKDMFWSDNPQSDFYNKLIKFKDTSYENLYKENNTYDIVIVINYNISPIIKGKGSAIFIHLAKKDFSPTSGCIALRKKCIFEILENLNITDKIRIISD
jgi:L,D-peptidoglycan transpeptidase YkuD (ErfK/YbiS/YcfS/YnhG family)